MVTTLQTAMSSTQLITATLGVILSFIIYEIEFKKVKLKES